MYIVNILIKYINGIHLFLLQYKLNHIFNKEDVNRDLVVLNVFAWSLKNPRFFLGYSVEETNQHKFPPHSRQ